MLRFGKGIGCALFNDQASASDKARAVARDVGRGLTLTGIGSAAKAVTKGVGKAISKTLATRGSGGTANSAQGALLKEHLRQYQKYGKRSIKELSDGRFRYYDKLKPPEKAGEMAGQRMVREWNTVTGNKRTWFETIDHRGNVRQVRPVVTKGSKTHYMFDKKGNYVERW